MRALAFLLSATLLSQAGSAQAPVRTVQLSPRDVAEAQQQHAAVLAEFGGAETGSRGAYVQAIGNKVGVYSGIAGAGQSLRFTTLNSAVDNAFAVPGGYVYITRQLMTLMEDESNLAFVVGHETGHIAARHAQKRQSAATKNQVLGIIGALIGSQFGGALGELLAQGAQQFSQLQTLKYSRGQENEADTLGMTYMIKAGYDPVGAPVMLAALGRSSALQARVQGQVGRSTPAWALTHPKPEQRVASTTATARKWGRLGTGVRNRDQFLAQLDGVYVDDDPAQGVIEGTTFTHPDLRLQFRVPTGYQMQNGTEAVLVDGSGGQAKFTTVPGSGNVQTYMTNAIRDLAGNQAQIQLSPLQQTTIGGIPAFFTSGRAQTQSGVVDVTFVVYQFDANRWYHFAAITPGGRGANAFSGMFNSVRRISAQEAAAIRPRVIDVVTVKAGDTVASLGNRMAYSSFRAERFASLNGLAMNSALTPGQKVKLVVYGTRR